MKIKKLIAAMAIGLASAGVFGANAVLENLYIKAGVNETTGTMGSGGNTSPGLLYDSTGTGTFNTGYDYLTPGSPFEGFTVKVDGTQYRNNNAGNLAQITGAWTGTPTSSGAIWDGGVSGVFSLRNTYSLPSGQQYIGIQTRIEVTNAVTALYFARYIDPDARAAAGDSSVTDNVRGYSGIPGTNVIFSEALSSRYALGLYSSQNGNVNTGPSSMWSTDPDSYYSGGNYTVGSGDHTIGIAFYSAGLSAGDIVTYNYAYIFGPNAFGAATTATTSYDPGATFTVANVGSATSAASAPSTPTVTGTSTATITVSDTTVVNSALPVISGSVAHHTATESTGIQTIDRETTTTVTTPMRRDVVTKIRTTTTYSDSTTSYVDSATTTTTTYSDSVASSVANDSFSGRIDQMSVLSDINTATNRGLNMSAFRGDSIRGESGVMYVNGTGTRTTINNGYKATGEQYGVGIAVDVDRDLRVGFQYNRAHVKLDGLDSKTTQNKDHVGLFSVYKFNDALLETNFGHADNTINNTRTISVIDFSNSHNTKGSDTWLSNRLYSPSLEGVRPFVGYTVGRSVVNGYTESGSIQSLRTVQKVINNYDFVELGLRYDVKMDHVALSGEASTTSDNFRSLGAKISYNVSKDGQIAVTGSRQSFKDQTTNIVAILGVVKF